MDDDGQGHRDIRIRVRVEIKDGTAHLDFSGTAGQVPGNINCPLAVAAARFSTCSAASCRARHPPVPVAFGP